MKRLIPLLFCLVAACKGDPVGAPSTTATSGTMSAAGQDTAAIEHPPAARDTALTGTFGGGAPGRAPGESATTATHPGATGTDAVSMTDPNSPITNPPPAPRSGT
jgi:hypothetical protein